jgi:hypothetical protein
VSGKGGKGSLLLSIQQKTLGNSETEDDNDVVLVMTVL